MYAPHTVQAQRVCLVNPDFLVASQFLLSQKNKLRQICKQFIETGFLCSCPSEILMIYVGEISQSPNSLIGLRRRGVDFGVHIDETLWCHVRVLNYKLKSQQQSGLRAECLMFKWMEDWN